MHTTGTADTSNSATDTNGVTQMQFSNDNTNWSTAEAYAATKSWTLSAGDGIKTLRQVQGQCRTLEHC